LNEKAGKRFIQSHLLARTGKTVERTSISNKKMKRTLHLSCNPMSAEADVGFAVSVEGIVSFPRLVR